MRLSREVVAKAVEKRERSQAENPLEQAGNEMHLSARRGNKSIPVRLSPLYDTKEQVVFAEFGWNHGALCFVPFGTELFYLFYFAKLLIIKKGLIRCLSL